MASGLCAEAVPLDADAFDLFCFAAQCVCVCVCVSDFVVRNLVDSDSFARVKRKGVRLACICLISFCFLRQVAQMSLEMSSGGRFPPLRLEDVSTEEARGARKAGRHRATSRFAGTLPSSTPEILKTARHSEKTLDRKAGREWKRTQPLECLEVNGARRKDGWKTMGTGLAPPECKVR